MAGSGPLPWGGGRYHVGKPYQVAGQWFTPKEQPGYDKKGTASWYGEDFNRRNGLKLIIREHVVTLTSALGFHSNLGRP